MKEYHKYCVYFTIYSGSKLPLFYIGSSSIKKVKNGYNGSVRSKKYKDIYRQEQKENKHLFKTIIIRTCVTRRMALAMEYFLQKKDNVVNSELFYNMSFAKKNGFFGRDVRGKNNPFFGKSHSTLSIKKISNNRDYKNGEAHESFGRKHTVKTKMKISDNHTNVSGKNNPMWGVKMKNTSKQKMSDSWKERGLIQCPFCSMTSKNMSNMQRYHFDKCKFKHILI